jgi:prevent-host-death family protein
MITVGAFEAKTHLSSLLDRLAEGEGVVINNYGKPVARLVSAAHSTASASMTRLKSSSFYANKPHSAGSPGRRSVTQGAGERSRHRFIRSIDLVFRRRGLAAIGRFVRTGSRSGRGRSRTLDLEVANVLLQAERRGRIATGDVAMRLELIAELPITTDNETTARAWREILALARAEGLTTYDAAYLELAIRRGLPLQTKDEALIGAAKRTGVAIPS